MDKLMALVSTAAEKASPELQKDLKSLVETRTNEKWASAEAENAKAREESAKSLEKPAPRKSAAIRIEVNLVYERCKIQLKIFKF